MVIKSICSFFLDKLLPPQCSRCSCRTADSHKLCGDCWEKIRFLDNPQCQLCGWPFEFETKDHFLCADCSRQPPLFTKGRSALQYDDITRHMIIKFKHGDGVYLSKTFATLMKKASGDVFEEADILMPIPLHRWRLFRRGYNQSALLVKNLAKLSKIPAAYHVLCRHKSTKSQEGLSRKERLMNMRNVFCVPEKKKRLVQNKVIVLIDDVWTTGATLTEACRTLLSCGAREVRVLTLARVIRPNQI